MTVDEQVLTTAAAASATIRDLAHATIAISDPEDLYPLVGDFLGSVRSLAQIAEQIARAHLEFRGHAQNDNGDPAAGIADAMQTAQALRHASALLNAAESSVDVASQHSGRIAWQRKQYEPRWVSVVFLQGEEADETLDIVDRQGPGSAISHLKQWDIGDETTDAALVNGYVYDTIPACSTDNVIEAEQSGYALTYNLPFRYVSLLRRHPGEFEGNTEGPAPKVDVAPPALPPSRTWFTATPRPAGNAMTRDAL
jgi:hypothetical protein